jgi:hypothetical protein
MASEELDDVEPLLPASVKEQQKSSRSKSGASRPRQSDYARRAHRALSILLLPFLMTAAVTGGMWTLEKHWLGIPKPSKWLMQWHQGDLWLGWTAAAERKEGKEKEGEGREGPRQGLPLTKSYREQYMWCVGLCGVMHFSSGYAMTASTLWDKQVAQQGYKARQWHHYAAILFGWPLTLTIVSGCAYRLLRIYGFEKTSVRWVLDLHQGFFGILLPVYPLLLGLVVAVFSASGIFMLFVSPAGSVARQLGCTKRRPTANSQELKAGWQRNSS